MSDCMRVVDGSKDYRLVEAEGLGAFNAYALPLLLSLSEAHDFDCNPFDRLQRLGIPSRLLIFPSENHCTFSPPLLFSHSRWRTDCRVVDVITGVLNPANSVQWHREVFKWIGEWTNTKDECE